MERIHKQSAKGTTAKLIFWGSKQKNTIKSVKTAKLAN
jgi:hypothetical protein